MASFRCLPACPHLPGAALRPRPLQDLQVAFPRCRTACPLTPGAALSPQPLQDFEVASLRCKLACVLTPGAALSPQPLQDLQVPPPRCQCACPRIPGAALSPRPLQDLEVASTRCIPACPPIAGATLRPQPLKDPQVASPRRRTACPPIPGAALCPRPLQDLQVASPRCHTAYVIILGAALSPCPLQDLEGIQEASRPRFLPRCFHNPGAALGPQPLHQLQHPIPCRLHHPGLPRLSPMSQWLGPPLQDPQGPGIGVGGVVLPQGLHGAEVKSPRPEQELALKPLPQGHELADKPPHLGTGKGQCVASILRVHILALCCGGGIVAIGEATRRVIRPLGVLGGFNTII